MSSAWPPERAPRTTKQPYTSGFCSNGHCEGRRPVSPSGKGLPICLMADTCACKCHADIARMFAMMDMPRPIPEQNPLYKPEKMTAWMPTFEERVSSSIERVAVPVVQIESPAPALAPATMAREFSPTASGRAARGELEQWVKFACDAWVAQLPDVPCTPGWIARWIVEEYGVKKPSSGAIQSVLERWTKIGFATMSKKPVRFSGYTVDGIRHGLDYMKMKAKVSK